MTYDPAQRFLDLVPGGQGIFYAIQADGTLLWYRHSGWQNGARTWASGSGLQIGSQWHQFVKVLASQDGQLFALRADGTLLWYQYILTNSGTGAGHWHPNSGAQIGSGFNRFPRMFGGWDRVLYGVDNFGQLFWYRYAGTGGSAVWAGSGSGLQIGSGWKGYPQLWANPNGVLFGARQGGDLNWWRYIVTNNGTGAGHWANGGIPIQIGVDWGGDSQKLLASNTLGTIYAVALDTGSVPASDDTFTWYQLANSETVDVSGVTWTNSGIPRTIGTGFTVEASAALQGYASTLSVPLGGSVGIQVSTTLPTYSATVMREAPATSGGGAVQVVAAASHTGQLKVLPAGYRSAGCSWSTDFTVSVPLTWQSGVYSVRLTSSYKTMHPVIFVVRPTTPTNKIAVVIPTNTYNAYNTWGGHDQYTVGQDGLQRTLTLRRPFVVTTPVTSTGVINASLYSDLILLRWMTDRGIAYDCYEDGDLDLTGSAWLSSYKAVVLGTHPEYFTATARQNLLNYTAAGGRIVYTGGNGVYEQMTFTTDRSALVFRDSSGNRDPFDDLGLPTADVIGVDFNPASYMDFAPYQVVTSHALLAGTGLGVGDTFGATADNGSASGWEIDSRPAGATGSVVIATGLNPNGGADMTYTTKPAAGWVFAASSLSFNGALPYDSAVQQIMANVFAAAVA